MEVDETDLEAPIEGGGDPAEHGHGMPFVVGALEAADGGGLRPDEFCELALGEAGGGAEVVDLLRDIEVGALFFEHLEHLRVALAEAVVEDLDGVGRGFWRARHGYANDNKIVMRRPGAVNKTLVLLTDGVQRRGSWFQDVTDC